MAGEAEVAAMRRAAALAGQVLGRTYPNPAVGAVLLDATGAQIAEGRHDGPGTPHAEAVALRDAGDRARGGTMVVTLEPCGHHGQTPPCADALVAAGVTRVVYAEADPIPDHAGAETLRQAGIDVEQAPLVEVDAPWRYAVTHDRPYVTLKLALSVDGRAAARDGSSQWITGPEARADVHRLRAECDAILVGVGTVLADDCHLTVRDGSGLRPLRVVADTHGRTPPGAKVRDGAAATFVATADNTPTGPDGRLDLTALLKHLREEREIVHVLLEGGPTLAAAATSAGLVDRVVVYLAPCLLAGAGTIDAATRLTLAGVTQVGADLRVEVR